MNNSITSSESESSQQQTQQQFHRGLNYHYPQTIIPHRYARIFSTISRGRQHVSGNSVVPLWLEPRIFMTLERLGLINPQTLEYGIQDLKESNNNIVDTEVMKDVLRKYGLIQTKFDTDFISRENEVMIRGADFIMNDNSDNNSDHDSSDLSVSSTDSDVHSNTDKIELKQAIRNFQITSQTATYSMDKNGQQLLRGNFNSNISTETLAAVQQQGFDQNGNNYTKKDSSDSKTNRLNSANKQYHKSKSQSINPRLQKILSLIHSPDLNFPRKLGEFPQSGDQEDDHNSDNFATLSGLADMDELHRTMSDKSYRRLFHVVNGKSVDDILDGFMKREGVVGNSWPSTSRETKWMKNSDPFFIHFVSLDVEGHEFPILQDLLHLVKKKVIRIGVLIVELIHHKEAEQGTKGSSGGLYSKMIELLKYSGMKREYEIPSRSNEDEVWIWEGLRSCRKKERTGIQFE